MMGTGGERGEKLVATPEDSIGLILHGTGGLVLDCRPSTRGRSLLRLKSRSGELMQQRTLIPDAVRRQLASLSSE